VFNPRIPELLHEPRKGRFTLKIQRMLKCKNVAPPYAKSIKFSSIAAIDPAVQWEKERVSFDESARTR